MDFVLVILSNTDYTNIESLETQTVFGTSLVPLIIISNNNSKLLEKLKIKCSYLNFEITFTKKVQLYPL